MRNDAEPTAVFFVWAGSKWEVVYKWVEIVGGKCVAHFSVVAMMRETPEIIRRFVDYYLELGAAEVFVYYNGPAEEVPATAGATRINCDPAFWDRNSDMPLSTLEERMRICYRDCRSRCSTEWLLIVDADEFVFGEKDLSSLLDSVPDNVNSIGLPTAEAVWGPGDDLEQAYGSTHFRVKWPSEMQWRLLRRVVYGSISSQMRWGVIGHVAGKHLIRTDRSYSEIGGHRSKRNDVVVTVPAASVSQEWLGTYLGHFDAISLDRWQRKWRWRLEREIVAGGMSRGRTEQMQMVGKAITAGRQKALFQRFYGLSVTQFRTLTFLGHAFRRENFFERSNCGKSAMTWTGDAPQTKATLM